MTRIWSAPLFPIICNILEAADGSDNDPVISVNKKRLGPQPQGKKAATTKAKPTLTSNPIPGPSQARAASVEEVTR
jgi:hypothetical protein